MIVIEDKIDASEQSDQLARYRATVEEKFPSRSMIPVYLETGDQADYADVHKKEWVVYHRKDLLDVLRTGRATIPNAIFLDFLEHLESIESEAQAFGTRPLREWPWRAWRGFFHALKTALAEAHWGAGWRYVPNQRGGFMACHWGWSAIENGQLYLQLQQEVLAVKVYVDDQSHRRCVRDQWSKRVLDLLGDEGFERPPRLGLGASMTVAQLGKDYRSVGEDGVLEMKVTARCLTELTEKLDRLVKEVRVEWLARRGLEGPPSSFKCSASLRTWVAGEQGGIPSQIDHPQSTGAVLLNRYKRVEEKLDFPGLHRSAGSANIIDIHGDVHSLICTFCDYSDRVVDYSGLRIMCIRVHQLTRF